MIITKDNQNNDGREQFWHTSCKTIEEAREKAAKHILDLKFGEDRDYEPSPWNSFYLDSISIVEVANIEELDIKKIITDDLTRYNEQNSVVI